MKAPGIHVVLISMTRIVKSSKTTPAKRSRKRARPVKSGPQHVTVHGRDEVVIISADEFRRLRGDLTGEVLIAAMQASPHRDVDIEPRRTQLPVRDVSL